MSRPPVPTSALSALLRLVPAVLSQLGDATPVLVGKAYLASVGAAPRVVFVPDPRGTWGPPPVLNVGHCAGITHGCAVYVRAAETGDDATRFAAAEQLADRVIDVLRTLAPGRIAGGEWGDDSPADVDVLGADLALTFTYTRPVAHDPAVVDAIRAAVIAQSPTDPDRPTGDTGTTVTTALSAQPTR